MKSFVIASVLALSLAGCVTGIKTGPLSDPEVLSQRCAEANLAITAFEIVTMARMKNKLMMLVQY